MTSQPNRANSMFNPPGASFDAPPGGHGSVTARSSGRLRDLLQETVADVFDVDAELVRLPNRGRAKVALARQVAMYIAHVGCRLTLTEIGELFERDRTTVSHACMVVELKREEPSFDEAIRLLEQVIRVLDGSGRCGPALWLDARSGGHTSSRS